ncbi:ATP-binding cassette domain-containing protein [Parvimonas micra]
MFKKLYKIINFNYFTHIVIFTVCILTSIFQLLVYIYTKKIVDKFVELNGIYYYGVKIFVCLLFAFLVMSTLKKFLFSVIAIKLEYKILSKYILNIKNLKEEELNNSIVIMDRISKFTDFLDNNLNTLIYTPFSFIFTFLGIFLIDRMTAIIIIPVVITTVFIDFLLTDKLIYSSQKYYKENSHCINFQKEMLEKIENIKINSLENYVDSLHRKKQEKLLKSKNYLTFREQISYIPALLNEYLPTIILIFIAILRVRYSPMSYGQFFALLSMVVGISLPFTKFLRSVTNLKSVSILLDDIVKIINLKDCHIVKNTFKSLNFTDNTVINVKNLDFSYGNKIIFRDVNFSVKEDEKVSIIGETGTGKSTLIKIILGLYDLNEKTKINVFGLDINEKKREIWKNIGYVDNNQYLFDGSINYNITLKNDLTNSELKNLENIALMLDIKYLIDKEIDVKQFGTNLSGGEKLKICVARALFRKPNLLILDEPTSALDDYSEDLFCDLLKNINVTTILVTHRKKLMDVSDRILKISDNKLFEINKESEIHV